MNELGYCNYYKESKSYSTEFLDRNYSKDADTLVVAVSGANAQQCQESVNKINEFKRQLDEKLSVWAEEVRSKYNNEDVIRRYLSKKYFQTDSIDESMKWEDPLAYAMYENDYNAIRYGTIGSGNLDDPRLQFDEEDWQEYNSEEKNSKNNALNNNMVNLLKDNDITLSENSSLLIKFNPYTAEAKISGCDDENIVKQINELLQKNNNSNNLMYYAMQYSQNNDPESVIKYRAYKQVKEYTGLDLSKMNIQDGEFYTESGEKLTDVFEKKIKSTSNSKEFTNNVIEYTEDLISTVAESGWNGIKDMDLTLAYSNNTGFYSVGNNWEA